MNKLFTLLMGVILISGCGSQNDGSPLETSEAPAKTEVVEEATPEEIAMDANAKKEEALKEKEDLVAAAKKGGYLPGKVEVYEERTQAEVEALIAPGKVTADNWDEQKEALQEEGAEIIEVKSREIAALLPGNSLTTLIEAAEEGDVLDPTSFVSLPPSIQADLANGEVNPALLNQMQQNYYGYIKILRKATEDVEINKPKTVDSRHILLNHDEVDGYEAPESGAVTKDQARQKAESLLSELQGGADFETLAKEHSTGPSGPTGGNLGPAADGMMVPAFNAALFDATEPGLVSSLVETQFGFHIIEVIEIIEPQKTKEAEVVDFEMIGWPGDKPSWGNTSITNKDIKSIRSEPKEDQFVLIFELSESGQEKYKEVTARLAQKDTGEQGCAAGGSPKCQLVFLLEGNGLGAIEVELESDSNEIILEGGYDEINIGLIIDIANGMNTDDAVAKAQAKAAEQAELQAAPIEPVE